MPGGRTSAEVSLDGRRSRNDSEPDQRAVLFPATYRSGAGAVSVNTAHFEAFTQVSALNFKKEDRSDGTAKRLELSLLPMRSRTSALLVSYRGRELDLNGSPALTSNAALAGFRRQHFAGLASQWELGAAKVDYRDGARKPVRVAVTARVTLYGRGPNKPVVADAKLERDAATTMSAMLQRRSPLGVASAKWETRLEAEGGYYTTPVMVRRLSLALVDSLGSRTTLRIEGSRDATRPFRAPGLRADTYRGAISLSVRVHTWVKGNVGYDYLRQTNPDRAVPINFRRSRFIASLTADFQ